jgi:hypothetical protein
MITDLNLFAGNWPFYEIPASDLNGILNTMDNYGIEKGLISPIEAIFYRAPDSANKNLSKSLTHPDKLLFCPVLNPMFPSWEKELESNITEDNAKAVRAFPSYHGYNLDCEEMSAFCEKMSETGLPLIIHLKIEDLRNQHPLMRVPNLDIKPVIELAEKHKNLKLIIAGASFPELNLHSDKIKDLPNLFADISWLEGVGRIEKIVAKGLSGKLLFGSQAPLFYMKSAIMKIENSDIPPEEKEKIFKHNAMKFFK